jgi:hypothetical protein
MTDLTKILKKGDRLWDSRYGEVEVLALNHRPYPVTVASEAGILSYTKEGRPTALCEITLYPLDQKPAPPQWTEVPKTFEWEGEIYTEGEWVAVRVGDGEFNIRQLQLIIPLEMRHPIKCSNGWVYSGMRKLSSFNQSEEKE